jgi:hypothetical protein
LDFVTFEAILESFKYYYDNHTTFTEDGTIKMLDEAIPQGQPRLISSSDGLGLVLTWTTDSWFDICFTVDIWNDPIKYF